MTSFNWPESYYVGQEYVEDKNKIEVLIEFKFRSAVIFSNLNFRHGRLGISQQGEDVSCTLRKSISLKLYEEIVNPKNATSLGRSSNFILGYIKHYMPIINEQIEKLKYLDGHILVQSVSLFDFYEVNLINLETESIVGKIAWPVPIGDFPLSRINPNKDVVFVRDVINAMTSYFRYDLDDCVRKIITSLENCFSYYDLSDLPRESIKDKILTLIFNRKFKIKKIINTYIIEKYYPYTERDLKKIRENILFIYKLRNLVVHDKLRINHSQTTVCRKAIGTLLYLYQGNFINTEHRTYIYSLYSQFIMIYESHSGYSLEVAEWNEQIEKTKNKPNIINSPDDMNRWMFENLRITKKEKKSILSGLTEEHLPPNDRIKEETEIG